MAKWPDYDRERLARLMGREMRDNEDKRELGLRDDKTERSDGLRDDATEQPTAEDISTVLPDEIVVRIREVIEWVQKQEDILQQDAQRRILPIRKTDVIGQPYIAAKLDDLFHDIEMWFIQESQPKVTQIQMTRASGVTDEQLAEAVQNEWRKGRAQIVSIAAKQEQEPQTLVFNQIAVWRSVLEYHQKDNPTHGVRCICMDRFSRDLRSMLNIPHPPYSLEDQERYARLPVEEGGMGLAAEIDSGKVGIAGHGVDTGGVTPQFEGLDEETGCKHERHVNPFAAWLDGPQNELKSRILYILGMITRNP